jgi:hypothetical protein
MIYDIDDVAYAYIRLHNPDSCELLDDKDILAVFLPVG